MKIQASASFQVSERPFLQMTQPVLEDGGTITNAAGVTLGAVAGALPSSVPVTMVQTTPSPLPLPPGVRPVSDYFNISAAEDVYVSFETPFILGIPVPAGEPTDGLAIAVLQPTEDFRDQISEQEEEWVIFPGVYRPEDGLFLITLPFLAADGRKVVLVEHPAFIDTAQQQLLVQPQAAMQHGLAKQSTIAKAATTNFLVLCLNFPNPNDCGSAQESAIAQALQDAYTDFIGLGYTSAPRLMGPNANLSINPPTNPPPYKYWAYIYPSGSNCNALGTYSVGTGMLRICLSANASIGQKEIDTIRHEFFHAIQFAYPAMLATYPNDELWITEGTAEAATRSLSQMERNDTVYPLHVIDVAITEKGAGQKLYHYHAQDFWVYRGQFMSSGMDMLIDLFDLGAELSEVETWIGGPADFDEAYWGWVKNQIMHEEATTDLGNGHGNYCEFNPSVLEARFSVGELGGFAYSTDDPGEVALPPLTARTIELKDNQGGEDARIIVLEMDGTLSSNPDLYYKIYKEKEPGCEALPEGEPRILEETETGNFVVLLANRSRTDNIEFRVEIEELAECDFGACLPPPDLCDNGTELCDLLPPGGLGPLP